MKIVEITPRKKSSLYGGLVKREAEIRKRGRGTFARKGPMRAARQPGIISASRAR